MFVSTEYNILFVLLLEVVWDVGRKNKKGYT